MPSITYWSQLFPSPRSTNVAESLAARVRNPAWFLARQWQLGEFQGADAGSPAFARILSHTAAIPSVVALEPAVENEPFTPDLATRVEVGQTFEALLARAQIATAVRDAFRAAYPIAPATSTSDATAAGFLHVCAGRATDGVALYTAARAGALAAPTLDTTTHAKVAPVLTAFTSWVEATWGAFGLTEPAAWDATRLAYDFTVTATAAGGGELSLAGTPDGQADFDWYSFDVANSTPGTSPATQAATSVLPNHVRFRGMPASRWWTSREARPTSAPSCPIRVTSGSSCSWTSSSCTATTGS